MLKRILLLAVFFVAIVFLLSLFREKSIDLGELLNKGWRFHSGDNMEWANTAYDDQEWQEIDPSMDIHDSFPELKKSVIGWLRLKIPFDSIRNKGNLAVTIQQSVASEIYLNGKLIQRNGSVSADAEKVKAYDPLWKPVVIPFSNDSIQVLAVRMAASPSTLYTTIFETANPLISLRLLSFEEAIHKYHSITTNILAFDLPIFGISIMLLILHLSFYALYPRQKANLYFSFYALFSALGYSMQVYFWAFNSDVGLKFILGNFIFFLFLLSNLSMLFSLQRFLERKKDLFLRLILVSAVIGCILNAYPYNTGWRMGGPIVQLLIQIDITRIAFLSIRAKKKGAWIIATGGIATFIFFASFISQGTFSNTSLIESLSAYRIALYILFALSLPAAVSVFLALDFAFTNDVLQQKIRENNELAERNLTQQKEKQELLSSMNQQLEAQVKERTEELSKSLDHLKSTQAQLIQSEKMASLGELTAGIAHEIQNPLNFVNNFSEVNTELLKEMKTEIDKGNLTEARSIADNIIDNEDKINTHGKRADSIVKGMLQHSRTNPGQKEPTDINALADEYLRLSYHGLRAKDGSFNATLKTDFDPLIGKISIVPQDIGRVLLNLFNNAFYAVSNPLPPKGGVGFQPTVTVSTKLIIPPPGGFRGAVEIRISDNGNGIPQKILDKIFQPFFTTKPTGQGTGLGLSLSYDIIKAHGGEIKVKTREGEGSEFIIQLPLI